MGSDGSRYSSSSPPPPHGHVQHMLESMKAATGSAGGLEAAVHGSPTLTRPNVGCGALVQATTHNPQTDTKLLQKTTPTHFNTKENND